MSETKASEPETNLQLFMCDDGQEALAIYHWDNDGVRIVEIAPWRAGFNGYDFRTALRHLWSIIRYGHLFCDFVVYSQGQTRDLGEYLISITK